MLYQKRRLPHRNVITPVEASLDSSVEGKNVEPKTITYSIVRW